MATRALILLLGISIFLATIVSIEFRTRKHVLLAAFAAEDDAKGDTDGRQLGGRRRRKRTIADARELHNRTDAQLPLVETSLRFASTSLSSFVDSTSRPSSGIALDELCHAHEHTGYSGDGAAVWGLGFKVRDAGECCAACRAHLATCGVQGGRGKSWWSARPELHCGSPEQACTIWTFCPEERCFAFDIHKHGFGECWLKFQNGIPPTPRTAPWRLKNPHFRGTTYPEIMRHAPRKTWPWPVDEKIWQGPMPKDVPWISGALAEAGVEILSAAPSDRWKERWCKKHGPCPGEEFDI
eukprot:jgi/Chrpa1/21385/Chrysochromulina_OHIO_Genome00028078-RA